MTFEGHMDLFFEAWYFTTVKKENNQRAITQASFKIFVPNLQDRYTTPGSPICTNDLDLMPRSRSQKRCSEISGNIFRWALAHLFFIYFHLSPLFG